MEASALKYQSGLSLQTRPPLLRLQSDDRLVALSRRGVPAAFEVLVKRYESRLLAFCRHLLGSREDAEDILQDVFTAAYNAMLADDRSINVRPWLYRIARNRSLNHLRRAQTIGVDSMDVHLAEHGTTTADKVHDREEFRVLVGDIHSLPESQRTALVLREMDALSYEQIAEAMDTTVPSVKSLLVRARVSLAEAAEARALPCESVRTELGEVAEGLIRRPSTLVRRHLTGCVRCEAFRLQLKETNSALAAVMPAGPFVAFKKLLLAHLGHGASSAGSAGSGVGMAGSTSAAAGGAAAAGGVAAGSMIAAGGSAGFAGAGFSALASKAAAGLAAAALVTAGAVAVDPIASHRAVQASGETLRAAIAPQVLPDPANAEQRQVVPAPVHHPAAQHPPPAPVKASVAPRSAVATKPSAAAADPVKPGATAVKPVKKPAGSTAVGTTQELTVTTVLAPTPGSGPAASSAPPSGSSPSSVAGSPGTAGGGSTSSGPTTSSGSASGGSTSGGTSSGSSSTGSSGSGSSSSGSSSSSSGSSTASSGSSSTGSSGSGSSSSGSGSTATPTATGTPATTSTTSSGQPSGSTSAPSSALDAPTGSEVPPPDATTTPGPAPAQTSGAAQTPAG